MTRFIDNKDGTVTDTSTNLMWQQGKGEKFTFEEAQEYTASLTLAGYNNWRLPTIEELRSIVDYNRKDPVIDPVFKCETTYYWSSTIVNSAWGVVFGNGHDYWISKDFYFYVRCVRDFKKES